MQGDRKQFTVKIPIKNKQGQIVDYKEVIKYEGLLTEAHKEGLSFVSTDLVQIPTDANGQVAIVKAEVTTKKGRFSGLGDANPDNVNAMVVRHLLRVAETRAKARAMRDAINVGMVSLEELGSEAEEDILASSNMAHGTNGSNGHAAQARTPAAPQPTPTSMSGVTKPSHLHEVQAGDRLPTVESDATSMSHGPTNGIRHADGREVAPAKPFSPMTEAQRKLLFRLAFNRGHQGEGARDFLLTTLGVDSFKEVSKNAASALIDQLQDHFADDLSRREREYATGAKGGNGVGVYHG